MSISAPVGTPLSPLLLDAERGVEKMNRLASAGTPFLFLIDAWARAWAVLDMPEALAAGILWSLEGTGPLGYPVPPPAGIRFTARPPDRETYRRGFDIVRRGQIAGDSYLANLTFPSLLDTNLSLEILARSARAPFRLWVPGHFTVFSPERFVRIGRSGAIASYPMKGTIDASVPDAAARILADEKEAAEHVTIVDLIRNDLSRVARRVSVPRYRFITEVAVRGRTLLQVSSEIRGELDDGWRNRVGEVMARLLPAGSVTGAPKRRTCEIIREAEAYDRGWYTGVFGVFDGRSLDSGVMIRFIERGKAGTLVYKSGGGVTIYSDMESEYAELEAKVYAPFG